LNNYLRAIHVFNLAGSKSTQITDGMSDARYPVFDRDGKYLYFAASTDSGAALQPDIHSIRNPVSSSLYLTVLSKSEASPLAPESDEEKSRTKRRTRPSLKRLKPGMARNPPTHPSLNLPSLKRRSLLQPKYRKSK
jgi:tricorn protease